MKNQNLQDLNESIKKEAQRICMEIKPIILYEAEKMINKLKEKNYQEFDPITRTTSQLIGLRLMNMSYGIIDSLFNNAITLKTSIIDDPLISLISSQNERIRNRHLNIEIQNLLYKEFKNHPDYLIATEYSGYHEEKSFDFLLVKPEAVEKERKSRKRKKIKRIIGVSVFVILLSFFHLF